MDVIVMTEASKIIREEVAAPVELVSLEPVTRQVRVVARGPASSVVRKAITRLPVPRTQNRKPNLLSRS
jgi:hypothetical protein